VIAKLALIVSVIIVGATVIRPVLKDDGQLDDAVLVGAAAWDVAALALATGLAVFKPGERGAGRGARRRPVAASQGGYPKAHMSKARDRSTPQTRRSCHGRLEPPHRSGPGQRGDGAVLR
jgi:hypothetical protein